jgi:endonuclease YncB( thermonuclease family)
VSITAVEAGEVVGDASVVDGDTLVVAGERVRLSGIDAPEQGQQCERDGRLYACGVMAREWMAARVDGGRVRCTADGRDRYDRLLAVCFANGTNLNDGVVRAGWALAFRRYSREYVSAEDVARKERRGLWSGRFDPPWQWRTLSRLDPR